MRLPRRRRLDRWVGTRRRCHDAACVPARTSAAVPEYANGIRLATVRAGCLTPLLVVELMFRAAVGLADADADRSREAREAGNPIASQTAGPPVEEMLVVGEPRPELDVLPGSTTTRIETELRLIEGAGLDDLLAEVPGVQIRRFGGLGERFEISIRGSRPEQVPVLLDGVRLDSSLSGRSDLSTLCLDVVEEIQVTRGAGAARAGSGGIGGVVNLVSRRPTEQPETRVRIGGGHFGTVEGSLRHARRLDDWDLSLAYCGFHSDGDFEFQRAPSRTQGNTIGSAEIVTRENNDADRHTALWQLGRTLGNARMRLSQLGSHLERGAPGLEQDPRTRAREENASLLTRLGLDLTGATPAADQDAASGERVGRFSTTLSHRFEDNRFEDPEPTAGRDEIDSETTLHTLAGQSSFRLPFHLLGGRHDARLLGEARFDHRGSNEAKSRSRAGVALRAELSSHYFEGRLRVSPSLRFERYSGLSEEWLPGLFVEADPVAFWSIRAAASRSYRIPSFQELYLPDRGFERGNERLRPEEAWNFEVGTRLSSPLDSAWLDLEIEATWFRGEIDESIVFQLISSNVVAPVNTGAAETRGYELSLRWTPHPWWRMTAARTVTRTKLESTGRNVAGIAVSQIDGRFEFGPRDRFKLVGEIHYTGRIPLDSGGLAELPSRVAYDASLAIDLARIPGFGGAWPGRSLWLSLRGRNLGDVALRDTRSFPRPGRSASVALEGVF